jgi:peptidoglycan/LPS O-acetylase OafA/YrhL
VHRPFHLGNLLAIAGGAALAIIGIVALVRGDLNESWDAPVTTVLDIDHTPLLAALEVAAGALLVLFGMTGRRFLAMLAAVGVAVAAAVAAVEPGRLATQYALEEWWAWTVAGAAAFVALVLMLPSRRREVPVTERRVHRREPVTT